MPSSLRFLVAELVLILLDAFFLYKCNLGPVNGLLDMFEAFTSVPPPITKLGIRRTKVFKLLLSLSSRLLACL